MVATVGSSSRPYSKGGKRKRLGFQNLGAWQRGSGEPKPLRRLALVHWRCHLSTQRTDPWVWCPHRSQENGSIQLGLLPGSLVGVLGWRRQNCFCTCYKLDSRTIDKQLLLPRVKKVRESAFSSQENAGLLSSTPLSRSCLERPSLAESKRSSRIAVCRVPALAAPGE